MDRMGLAKLHTLADQNRVRLGSEHQQSDSSVQAKQLKSNQFKLGSFHTRSDQFSSIQLTTVQDKIRLSLVSFLQSIHNSLANCFRRWIQTETKQEPNCIITYTTDPTKI